MKAPGAARAGTPGPGSARRLLPDILGAFLIYLVSGLGLLLAGSAVIEAPTRAEAFSPVLLILGILPLTSLVAFGIQLSRLVGSIARRRYGARLKARLAAFFMGFVLLASLPQAVFAIRLVGKMVERQASDDAGEDVRRGIALLGEWRDADASRLRSVAAAELPRLLAASPAPAAALAALQRLDPRLESLELFGADGARTSAGPPDARLESPPPAGVSGPLPAETKAGVSRLRYAVAWNSATAVLCLRLPRGFESGMAALADSSRRAAADAEAVSRWPLLIAVFYACFVVPLLLIALMTGMAAGDFVAEPLAALEEATKRVAAGDSSLRLLAKPGDERGWLISSFNRMLDEMERGREGLLIQERIDAWKDLAQRLAHELKNPLTPIRLTSERLLRTARNDPSRIPSLIESAMVAIIAEVEGMDALLSEFREFARLPAPQKDWIPLADLVEEAVAPYRSSYPEVRFELGEMPADLRLHVDRSMIHRALGNLLANAVEAMEGRGRIGISVDLVKTGESGYCRLRLSDSGPGIPDEIKDRVFLPYFTTREKGTGLGLAIVERIVHDHGGRIRFESAAGIGTIFWIDLPIER